MADTLARGASRLTAVEVRILSSAPEGESMHEEDWLDVMEYSIMKCRGCHRFVWYQEDTEDLAEACRLCGNVLIADTTCDVIGFTIGGESYFYIDDASVHESDISSDLFSSL